MLRPDLPAHGGDLVWASSTFNVPMDQWIDLSTGISPWSWPVPNLPDTVWRGLPMSDNALELAAAHYFNCRDEHVLPIPGTQFLISRIPHQIPQAVVAIPQCAYSEHELAWRQAGHRIVYYGNEEQLLQSCQNADVNYVVVINPNNPITTIISPDTLQKISEILWENFADKSLLLVDEAFIDFRPQLSLCGRILNRNALVLRSFGKYFGLAGLRLGFLVASPHWVSVFRKQVNPWLVSHPAQWIGRHAMRDNDWIVGQRARIKRNSELLLGFLSSRYKPENIRSCGLFHTVFGDSQMLYREFCAFADLGVLTRYIDSRQSQGYLRFGLPGEDIDNLLRRAASLNIY